MNKQFAAGLLLTSMIGVAGYLSYSSMKSKQEPAEESNKKVITLAENTVQQELDMDLSHIDPIETLAEPTLVAADDTPPPSAQTHLASGAAAPTPAQEVALEETSELQEPVQAQAPQDKSQQKVAQAPLESLKKEKNISKQEKMDAFARNMEGLHKQAADEWDKMSPEEREDAEQQVELFQQNFHQELERLSKLSPEDVEREKQEAMVRLERENPDAYQAVRSMEEMFMGLADAAD